MTDEEDRILKHLYGRLHDLPLQADVPEDVELYEPIYKPTPAHDEPIDLLAKHIQWNELESIQFFSGFRGSGKTTELFRLKQRLAQRDCVVLYANALDYINPSGVLDISDLLIALAGAFSDQLLTPAVLGKDIKISSYWERLTGFLSKLKFGGDIGVSLAGLAIKANLRSSPLLRQKLQAEMAAHIGTLKGEIDEFIREGVRAIQRYQGDVKPIVFLFDSLEQIRGTVSIEREVLRSIESVFGSHTDKLKLPDVHVVYTVPPWLKFVSPGMARMVLLPGVRLWNNDDDRTPFKEGLSSLRSLVQRRLGDAGVRLLLGDLSAADRLIEVSGGHLRDLLLLLRETMLRARSLPVAPEVLDRAIESVRSQYLPIAVEDARWLEHIATTRSADQQTPEDAQRLVRFLDTHMVLYLMNGKEWYDVHPLIRDEVFQILARDRRRVGSVDN